MKKDIKLLIFLVIITIVMLVLNNMRANAPSKHRMLLKEGYSYKDDIYVKDYKKDDVDAKYSFNSETNTLSLRLVDSSGDFTNTLNVNYNFSSSPTFTYEVQDKAFTKMFEGSYDLLNEEIDIKSLSEIEEEDLKVIGEKVKNYLKEFNKEQYKINEEIILKR